MNRNIFRKYDIRGVFPDDLDDSTVMTIGRAMADLAGPGGLLAVGRDCRLSGEYLFGLLARGAASGRVRIADMGVQTTPMTYFGAHHLLSEATVMITGSHNPPEYNGFKIMKGLHTLSGDEIAALADTPEPPSSDLPEIKTVNILENYLDRLRSEFCLERSLKVVVDAGNGTGGIPACRILTELGCRVVPLFCEPDGRFPGHHPDPTVEENLVDLKKAVLAEGADIGLAFDGDADRLGVVDERGRTVFGDRILTVLARALLESSPGATVISEVKASRVFYDQVAAAGGRPIMSATGHSLIKQRMLDENALLAGEMSGHIFYRDRYYGYDDALYASLRLLEIIAASGGSMSDLLSDIPELESTPELREDCPDALKFRIVEAVRNRISAEYPTNCIDGVRIDFPDGWGLLRASNTQPVLVMRFEAGSREALDSYERTVRKAIEEARRELDVQTDDRGHRAEDR